MHKKKDSKNLEIKRLEETAREIRKDYFMSSVPMFVILSYYLIQAGLNHSKFLFWDLPSINYSLSIFIFLVALFLTYASVFPLPQGWLNTTYLSVASLGVVGGLVFTIDWLKSIRDLMELHTSPWYLWLYVVGGEIIIVGIIVFHFIKIARYNKTKL